MEEKKNQIVDLASPLLDQIRPGSGRITDAAFLAGDGSQRLFCRLRFAAAPSLIAVLPGDNRDQDREEARSAWLIGTHLYRAGVPVPEPLARDGASGLILFEDLGDVRLYDFFVHNKGNISHDLLGRYREVVRELVRMQIRGGEGFEGSWCWQTSRYDRQLMLERESGYFVEALCRDFLHLEIELPALQAELDDIADHAAAAPAGFFLHRDFQSRNLMLKDGQIRIVDFQGGRFGPLGYDLASLLIDPYMGLPEEVQEDLLAEYIRELQKMHHYDPARFREEYGYLALQRNMQILGAFAFLGRRMAKPFFLPYIRPALLSLQSRLAKVEHRQYFALLQLVNTCLEKISYHEL